MNIAHLLLPALIALALSSCIGHRELINFNQGPEFPPMPDSMGVLPVLRIQPDDALLISIHTLEPSDAVPFNLSPGQAGALSGPASNFLVDDKGLIEMPVIGPVMVAGLNIAEARDSIHR